VEEREGTALASYLVFGAEKGENQTPHLQGYVELTAKRRLQTLKNKLHATAHWEARKGTAFEASEYCKKDDDYFETGTLSTNNQGTRTDIEEALHLIKQGKQMSEVAELHPMVYVRMHRGLQALKSSYDRSKPKIVPEVIVFHGQTGVGKTYKVTSESPSCFMVSNYKWYDGYDGVSDICFDEYMGQITINNFLRLLDRYPVQVETKGGVVVFNPPRIYITSHSPPSEWYPDHPERLPELMRRITRVHELKRKRVRRGCGEGCGPDCAGTGHGFVTVTEVGGNTVPQLRSQSPPRFI
jgi:hypothetical protein